MKKQKMNLEIALNTLAFNGYSWEIALNEIAELGVQFIEPVYISKYNPQLKEAHFTQTNARKISSQIEKTGLKVRSLASHMDMGLADSVYVFQKRMEFAKNLGAEIILTNSSHIENEREFFINMEVLARSAEQLKLKIGLENPGDGHNYIMNNASEGAAILVKFPSEWVTLNYDFSNIHTLTKGRNTYDNGLEKALPHIAHLHLKNVKQRNGHWLICGLEEGIINYKKIFRKYPALWNVPMSIELPVRFEYDKNFDFMPQNRKLPSLERIHKILYDSIIYLENLF